MTPVLELPQEKTESSHKRSSAHLPVGKTVGHHHSHPQTDLKINSHIKIYIWLPFLKIYKCLNILSPPHILALSLCEVQTLTNLIRCLLSVLRGGDKCAEVAGWWRCEWTTTGASAARVVKCAAGVVRELADVDQFLHNCALVPQVNRYVSAECAMLCPHPCTTFPPNTRCAGCGWRGKHSRVLLFNHMLLLCDGEAPLLR